DSHQARDWSFLRHPSRQTIESLLKHSPTYGKKLDSRAATPYSWKQQRPPLPGLSRGLYVVCVSDRAEWIDPKAYVEAVLLNLTDVVLVGSAGRLGTAKAAFHYNAADAETGEWIKNAQIHSIHYQDSRRLERQASTDLTGYA